MNFLEICQKVRQECGIAGTGPVSVENQTGMNGKLVSWVNSAYKDIQRIKQDWRFRQAIGSFETTANNDEYLSQMSAVDNVDLEKVTIYLTSKGVSDEVFLCWLDYDTFYARFKVGSQNTGKPAYFTMGHDGALILGPSPDNNYTVNFHYVKVIEVMVNNADIPIIPDKYLETIAWKACMYFAIQEEAELFYQMAKGNYKEQLIELKRNASINLTMTSSPLA